MTNPSEPPINKDDFDREFYEPALTFNTINAIGWSITVILFLLSIWLLWVTLIFVSTIFLVAFGIWNMFR